jgi:hypothetical protein
VLRGCGFLFDADNVPLGYHRTLVGKRGLFAMIASFLERPFHAAWGDDL